jgi:murein DD-endopeptidase MepM/ murein hydrolase activator NlpD
MVLLLVGFATSMAEPTVGIQRQAGGLLALIARNQSLCPETITVTARLQNMKPSKSVPFTMEIDPGTTVKLCTFIPLDVGQPSRSDYVWRSQMGSIKAQHDSAAVYALPYPQGVSHQVSQGHHGASSHMGEFSYAVDWRMPPGSLVCAARAGRVVKSLASSSRGGPTQEFHRLANVLSIQHEDGTLGEYVHLKKDGVLVTVGQQVQAGDTIALSGNTGFSTLPHLHFHVSSPVDGTTFRTLPVKFRTSTATAEFLESGRFYEAR